MKIIDVTGLYCLEQIQEVLWPRWNVVGGEFHVTVYASPNRLGPVHDLRKRYPWITFGMLGFEGAYAECLSWTSEEAAVHLEEGQKLGYAPLFKPPGYRYDSETEKACLDAKVILHHHPIHFQHTVKGLQVFPGPTLPDHVEYFTTEGYTSFQEGFADHPEMTAEKLKDSVFATPLMFPYTTTCEKLDLTKYEKGSA